MIVIQLIGGLGNQMFQYAVGRRLSIERRVPLKLDISGFKAYTLRTYKLDHFDISAEIATDAELARFTAPSVSGKLKRLVERRLLPRHRHHIYYEQKPYQFEIDVLNTPDEVYLQGYFQNEAYFKSIEPQIRRDFIIKTPANQANLAMAERIRAVNAISLHIRRGDYASNPRTRALHGLLPLEYYRMAAQRIAQVVVQPHFFVFSDDPVWAREHLQLDYPVTLVDHNDAEHDYEDLRLMSLCQYHVIANSSFSWWGAWLSSHSGKIVYAPERWILDRSINTNDTMPPNWTRLTVLEN